MRKNSPEEKFVFALLLTSIGRDPLGRHSPILIKIGMGISTAPKSGLVPKIEEQRTSEVKSEIE